MVKISQNLLRIICPTRDESCDQSGALKTGDLRPWDVIDRNAGVHLYHLVKAGYRIPGGVPPRGSAGVLSGHTRSLYFLACDFDLMNTCQGALGYDKFKSDFNEYGAQVSGFLNDDTLLSAMMDIAFYPPNLGLKTFKAMCEAHGIPYDQSVAERAMVMLGKTRKKEINEMLKAGASPAVNSESAHNCRYSDEENNHFQEFVLKNEPTVDDARKFLNSIRRGRKITAMISKFGSFHKHLELVRQVFQEYTLRTN